MANGNENQAAKTAAAEIHDEQTAENSGVRVTDKRRFTTEGEPVHPELVEKEKEIGQLQERLTEALERRRAA